MRRALALFLALYGLSATDPYAQTVPTRPVTDDSNSAASTAFVKNVLGALSGDCTINPATLVVTCTGGGGGSLVVGTTPITGGVNGDCLYDNGPGILGEKSCSSIAGYTQDFLAGVGFTPGSTTSLTLTDGPAASTGLEVFFDGVNQSANTWSYNVGTGVVTFNAAIPLSVQVVEARSVVGGAAGNVTAAANLNYGDIVIGAGGVAVQDSNIPINSVVTFPQTNLFKNSSFQILERDLPIGAMIGQGNSISQIPACTLTSTSTGGTRGTAVTFNVTSGTCDTLRVNDLMFYNAGGSMDTHFSFSNGTATTLPRVLSITTTSGHVTSYTSIPPNAYYPSSSSSGTVQQAQRNDLSGTNTDWAMWWGKTQSLSFWTDDYTSDLESGCLRAAGFFKLSSSAEMVAYQNLDRGVVAQVSGQPLAENWRVQQFIKGGSGTSRAFAIINGGSPIYGSAAAGTGSYEDDQLDLTSGQTAGATSIEIGVAFDGNASDAYRVCEPELAIATGLPSHAYMQPRSEIFTWDNTENPASYFAASVTFPTTVDPTTVYYTMPVDIYGETGGLIYYRVPSLIVNSEFSSVTAGQPVGWRNIIGTSVAGVGITFGPLGYSEVTDVMTEAHGELNLSDGTTNNSVPGFAYTYTTYASGLSVNDFSLDIVGARLSN